MVIDRWQASVSVLLDTHQCSVSVECTMCRRHSVHKLNVLCTVGTLYKLTVLCAVGTLYKFNVLCAVGTLYKLTVLCAVGTLYKLNVLCAVGTLYTIDCTMYRRHIVHSNTHNHFSGDCTQAVSIV